MNNLKKLETDRLIVIPLDIENFRLFIENTTAMERNLGVNITGKELSPEMKVIFKEPYQKAVEDEKNYLWYTNWQVVLKDENRIIGGITFKGLPNGVGEVEVGYGTDEEYQNRGYMTETLGSLIKWAFTQEGVESIIAETEKSNKPSQRVLDKVGMKKYKETEDCYWYKIDKN